MPHGLIRAAGGFHIGLALLALAAICFAQEAREERPQFGDSTWVAPSTEIEGSPTAEGPRVARPDRERGWEAALRAPFRVAFLPLRLVARGIEATGGLVERAVPPGSSSSKGKPKKGLKVAPEWIGAKATAYQIVGPGSQLSLKGTWEPGTRKLRLRGHVGDQVSYIGAGAEALYDYRPNRGFYGIGNSSDSRKTFFRRRMDMASGYLFAGRNWMRRMRVSLGLSNAAIGSGTASTPRAVDVFTEAEAPFLNRGSSLWWYGSFADLAAVDDSLSPTRGLHFRPEVRRFRSTDETDLHYDHWRFDARGYLPVFAKRRVLVGRLVYAGVDRRGGSAPVPFYRLPESADADRFAAYPTERFRDNRLALGRAEYRWEIMPPIWAVALGELGAVASTNGRLTARGAHPSVGGGLRAQISERRVARLEVARGHEGMNVRLDLETDF